MNIPILGTLEFGIKEITLWLAVIKVPKFPQNKNVSPSAGLAGRHFFQVCTVFDQKSPVHTVSESRGGG